MRSVCRRSVLICGVAALSFALIGLGVALASAAHRTGPLKRAGHRGLSAARVLSTSRATSSRVIVILRNQINFAPATRRRIGQRIKAEAQNNAGIERQVTRSGGRIYKKYHALNAFAAKVSANERSSLQRSSWVAQVVSDTIVTLPAPANPSAATTSTKHANAAADAQQVCPADPSKPLLEPEALQTTHTAFSDPSTPQAQSLAKGTGVKVAFFADGLDINNPDFIRPNGQPVFIDYKDFSGDGLNAPTGAAEAFGDASSIAAQGRETYDISHFVNPAHPLPAGCNITVRGIAPGASLIGMKVFGNANSAFNSVILQGLDYALSNDHPNVISESFGGYPIPDTTQDLTRQFNEQAVAAGVTVVESTGDSGVESSPSSASSDPSVIAAGASTTFRNYAQGTQYGYQFGTGGWLSDNISSIESAGFTMGGRVLDLVAPGEANWALCSSNTAIYEECVDYKGDPTNLQSFGGTSESAPLIAGGAALIIQAYRESHNGNTPSPALVRQLLTSTATDLRVPSVEQGAGEMDTLAAVQAAKSGGNATGATGQNLLVGPTQLDISGQAGTSASRSVQVTNVGTGTQIVIAHARAITRELSNQTGTVTLGSTPTFIDQFGSTRPYQLVHFNVAAGADRLLAFNSWAGPSARVGMTLLDPSGKFAAYTRPQGDGNHGEVDVHDPAAGRWTAIIFLRDGTFTGPVHWQFLTQDFGTVDSVTPSAQTIAPGQTRTFHLGVTLPGQAGDLSHDLVLDPSSGRTTIVPISLRSLVNLGNNGGSFAGDLIGGNGRNGAGQPGQIDTVDFNVPAGKPELSVALTFANHGTQVYGALIDPSGSEITAGDNVHTGGSGAARFTNGLQAYVPSPRPGRWRFVVDVFNPVGGQVLSAPYQGRITFAAPPVQAPGLPNSASKVLPAAKPATFTVSVNNNGAGTQDVFLDPRTPQRQAFSLLSLTPDSGIPLPIPGGTLPPLYLVPTETNAVDAAAQASEPVTFDFGFGDPDLAAITSGNSASASFATHEATPGVWSIAPDPVGPFNGPAPAGTVSTGMVAHTLGFDLDTSSSTGDIWQQTVDPNAANFSPVTLAPGQKGKLTLTITPSGRKGRTVRGTLFVDEFMGTLDIGGELVALPYEYTVG